MGRITTAVKASGSGQLTVEQLDQIALKVCSECGIKDAGLPSIEIIDLCYKSWIERFSVSMNKQEINLAFEMNINGELHSKIEHYQCFTREYFCNVLNAYLQRKKEVLKYSPKEEEPEVTPEFDPERAAFEDLIFDRRNVMNGTLSKTTPIKNKLEALNMLFEFEVTETQVANYRKIAINKVWSATAVLKGEARRGEKFGLEIELGNKIARIKNGPLTEKDEAEIQNEVFQIVYTNTILLWSESEFVEHVQAQISKSK